MPNEVRNEEPVVIKTTWAGGFSIDQVKFKLPPPPPPTEEADEVNDEPRSTGLPLTESELVDILRGSGISSVMLMKNHRTIPVDELQEMSDEVLKATIFADSEPGVNLFSESVCGSYNVTTGYTQIDNGEYAIVFYRAIRKSDSVDRVLASDIPVTRVYDRKLKHAMVSPLDYLYWDTEYPVKRLVEMIHEVHEGETALACRLPSAE